MPVHETTDPPGLIVIDDDGLARLMILDRPTPEQIERWRVDYPDQISAIIDAVDRRWPDGSTG